MAESSFGHGHWDYVGSFHHLRIPQNIHFYAANLCNGNSAKYFTHYAIPQSINTRQKPGTLASWLSNTYVAHSSICLFWVRTRLKISMFFITIRGASNFMAEPIVFKLVQFIYGYIVIVITCCFVIVILPFVCYITLRYITVVICTDNAIR